MISPFLPWLGCLLAFSAFAGDAGVPGAEALRNWPQWSGPLANGVAPLANPPIYWSETNNVRWKIPLPGKAHSSPIVFGDAVYVLARRDSRTFRSVVTGPPKQKVKAIPIH